MSVNFGGTNSTRYFTGPFATTISGDCTFIAVVNAATGSISDPRYFLSSGTFESPNSATLFMASGDPRLGWAIGGSNQQTVSPFALGAWYLAYGRRISGDSLCGLIKLDNASHVQSPSTSRVSDEALTSMFIGARSDISSTRMWKGLISWVAILDRGLSDTQLVELATQAKFLLNEYSNDVLELWDFSANSPTITGKVGGHVLTRQGTDYGADGDDPLPYESAPEEITFSGTISTQNGNVDSAFNLDLSTYFTGSAAPFSYSIQSGSLPGGLSISGNLITGTPTTEETKSNIVVRGTDANLDTADSNAFDFVIGPAASVTKGVRITLNARRTLLPVGALSDIVIRWWDSPTQSGAPDYESISESTNSSGVLEVDLDSATSLPLSGVGYLVLYRQGGTPDQDLHFAGRVQITDISA